MVLLCVCDMVLLCVCDMVLLCVCDMVLLCVFPQDVILTLPKIFSNSSFTCWNKPKIKVCLLVYSCVYRRDTDK